MKSLKKIFMTLLISLLCLGGVVTVGGIVLIGYISYSFDQATKPVTDVSRYADIIDPTAENPSPLVAHFPRSIPSNAQNVQLYYQPGALQGGTVLELRMQLPEDEIQRIQAQVQPLATRQYVPGSENNSPKTETSPDGSNVTYTYTFHTGASDDGVASPQTFPEEYAIYVLADTRGAPEYDWNHPELYGVAINEATSEVVYWMEDW